MSLIMSIGNIVYTIFFLFGLCYLLFGIALILSSAYELNIKIGKSIDGVLAGLANKIKGK